MTHPTSPLPNSECERCRLPRALAFALRLAHSRAVHFLVLKRFGAPYDLRRAFGSFHSCRADRASYSPCLRSGRMSIGRTDGAAGNWRNWLDRDHAVLDGTVDQLSVGLKLQVFHHGIFMPGHGSYA